VKLVLIAAAFLAVGSGATPRPHTIDLATGRFDRQTILGLTPAQVRAVLGKPDIASRSRFTWGKDGGLKYAVLFVHRRARTLVFETGVYRDRKVGDILARTPASFAAAIRSRYGDVYRLVKSLHRDGAIYVGELAQRDGPLHITFGSEPKLGTFVTVWNA
jgi:hypothetical protein